MRCYKQRAPPTVVEYTPPKWMAPPGGIIHHRPDRHYEQRPTPSCQSTSQFERH
jgi:hypothetical protein